MAVFNWDKWVAASPHPEIAQIVLEWLVAGNYDEPVWQARDALVNLLAADRERQKAPAYSLDELLVGMTPENVPSETDGA